MNSAQFFSSAWTWNNTTILADVALLAAYFIAFRWNRRAVWLVAALAVLVLTLNSPINALADGYLFCAHMLQHILLLLIVPAFLLLSLPRSISLAKIPSMLRSPFLGWLAGVGSMWFWHAPAMCNAAVSSRPVHVVQTISLVLLGTLFWSQIIAPRDEERLSPPAAVVYLFTACFTCSILGIIITFSPVAVCSIYSMPSADHLPMLNVIRQNWGITPERDQQIGGLLMWVPMCLIYLSAIFAQIGRWFGASPGHVIKQTS